MDGGNFHVYRIGCFVDGLGWGGLVNWAARGLCGGHVGEILISIFGHEQDCSYGIDRVGDSSGRRGGGTIKTSAFIGAPIDR